MLKRAKSFFRAIKRIAKSVVPHDRRTALDHMSPEAQAEYLFRRDQVGL